MNKAFLVFLTILLLPGCKQASHGASGERKAVIIIVDGIPRDVVEKLHVPVIFEIAEKGSYGPSYVGGEVGTYNQTPTISAVGYNTMLTGTWANKHNVWGNSNLSPNYKYWSLFRIAKEQKKPLTTAIFSSWTDNRTVLLGEGKPETGNLKIDYVYDGYDLDKENFPHKDEDLHVFDYDERVSNDAAECIREKAPDLSWVYLWYTDDAFHLYGDSKHAYLHVLKAGDQIRRVWDAVRYREENFGEDWLVIVTTDHGRTNDGFHHGGQSARERATWISSNKVLNQHFQEGKAAMVDINPTVCEYLGMSVPEDVAWNRDGISLLGKTKIRNLTYTDEEGAVTLHWEALSPKARVKIYYAEGTDGDWKPIGKTRAGKEAFSVKLDQLEPKKDYYKFAVVSSHESLNIWH